MTLRDYLEQAKISAAQFGRLIDEPRQNVHRYLNGTIPNPETMAKIADETGGKVTANDFFGIAA